MKRICPYCEKTMKEGVKFCPYCGRQINEETIMYDEKADHFWDLPSESTESMTQTQESAPLPSSQLVYLLLGILIALFVVIGVGLLTTKKRSNTKRSS